MTELLSWMRKIRPFLLPAGGIEVVGRTMDFQDDSQLLRAASVDRSADAFGKIVARYFDMVYSAALRQSHDAAAADDITQTVFIILWKKIGSIRSAAALPAWLILVTRYTALDAHRRAVRRRTRERGAAAMKSETTSPTVEWTSISLVIDAALAQLRTSDREAVVLRYFSNRSFREIGQAMGASEDAARKKINRATERLRAILAARGVRVPGDLFGSLLLANAVRPHGGGLDASIAAQTAAAKTASPAVASVARSLAWASLKPVVSTAVATIAVLVGGAAVMQVAAGRTSKPATATTPATRPVSSRHHFTGIVRLPDGAAATGARVFLCNRNPQLEVSSTDGEFPAAKNANPQLAMVTGRDGQFAYRPPAGAVEIPMNSDEPWHPISLVAIHEDGCAWLVPHPDGDDVVLQLRPWARIEGTLSPALRTGEPQKIAVDTLLGINARFRAVVTSDAQGNFSFSNVPPTELRVSQDVQAGVNFTAPNHARIVTPSPGGLTRVALGGKGRTVVGKFLPPKDADEKLMPRLTVGVLGIPFRRPSFATDELLKDRQKYNTMYAQWLATEEGEAYARLEVIGHRYCIQLDEQCGFRIPEVEPGDYLLMCNGAMVDEKRTRAIHVMFARGIRVHESGNAPGGDVVDLGEMQFQVLGSQ